MTRVFIALGANLGDPVAQVKEAARRLSLSPGIEQLHLSPLYLSDPVGVVDQPRFVNAALSLHTELAPLEVLDRCQAIEGALGRVRSLRWGPRSIDLDLILFGDQRLQDPRLELPHPRWLERAFVMRPILDLEPALIIQGRPLREHLNAVGEAGLVAL